MGLYFVVEICYFGVFSLSWKDTYKLSPAKLWFLAWPSRLDIPFDLQDLLDTLWYPLFCALGD